MKYRAVAASDLIVSEVGFSFGPQLREPALRREPAILERLVRRAYDLGITYFSIDLREDAAQAAELWRAAFPADLRGKVVLSSSVATPRFSASVDGVHLVFTDDPALCPALKAASGSAVSRPEAEGARRFQAVALDLWIDRPETGDALAWFDRASSDETGPSLFARLRAPGSEPDVDFSFLWMDVGRSRQQTEALLALRRPFVSSVIIPFASEAQLQDAATASAAPPLSAPELDAIERLWQLRRRVEPKRAAGETRGERAAAGF